MKRILFVIIAVFVFAGGAYADDALPINGYLLLDYSGRIARDDDFIVAEERFQLELAKDIYEPVNASFFVKLDFIRDELFDDEVDKGSETEIDTREAYITLRFDAVDLKAGRQITTWGVGDLVFINDIFPKDWTSLLSGRPLQYMKIGTTSIKLGMFSDLVNADLILTPSFTEDKLPDGRRLYAYFPAMPPAVTSTRTVLPEKDVSNSEVSLKLSKYVYDSDVSLYFHRTYWRTPHVRIVGTVAETFYPDLNVYGASLQKSLFGGVVKFEGGYYQSTDDETGTDPVIKNSERRYILGYEKEVVPELTASLQYYSEVMMDYDQYKNNLPVGTPKLDEIRRVIVLRLTKFMMYQTLKLSFYTQYSPSDDDYFINPEIKYNIADNLYVAAGANIFGGAKKYTMFGQFDDNDNLYTQLRYDF